MHVCLCQVLRNHQRHGSWSIGSQTSPFHELQLHSPQAAMPCHYCAAPESASSPGRQNPLCQPISRFRIRAFRIDLRETSLGVSAALWRRVPASASSASDPIQLEGVAGKQRQMAVQEGDGRTINVSTRFNTL